MVGRFSQMTPALVVDLDGTYLNCNSFSRFICAAVKKSGCRLSFIRYSLMRKLRLISHAEMKRRMLEVAERKLDDGFMDKFALSLMRYRDEEIARLVDNFDGVRILATAAPACYADPLAIRAGFDFCVATPWPSVADWHETRGEHKLQEVMRIVRSHSLLLHTVVSDHHDDMPLFRAGALRNILKK